MSGSRGLEARLEEVESRQQIADVIHAYCQHIDRNEPEAVAALFCEDCVVDYGPGLGGPIRGATALAERLAPDGAIAVQSTNPRMAPNSFWCIVRTMEAAGWSTRPYHAAVPSFGVWGYVLGTRRQIPVPAEVPAGCKFLTPEYLPGLFILPADVAPREVEINRLNTQSLVRYYERELEQ